MAKFTLTGVTQGAYVVQQTHFPAAGIITRINNCIRCSFPVPFVQLFKSCTDEFLHIVTFSPINYRDLPMVWYKLSVTYSFLTGLNVLSGVLVLKFSIMIERTFEKNK